VVTPAHTPDDGQARPSVSVVAPLDLDAVRTVQVGTALWLVALVALTPFWSRLDDDGHLWWLWTCVAGVVLGVLGVVVTTRRRNRLQSGSTQTPVR